MVNNYAEKVYAGFLGMNIGIRLGAPVEPTIWTYDRIQKTYGEIHNYVKEYKNFAADDDVNGPVFFLRALVDDAANRDIEPQDIARAWLNYTREGKGMFWWGGYGISTEHTAYLNLKSGIPAPQSGSIEQNGIVLAEQIGGQIFIDTWGFVNPGNPGKGADYGEAAASVSHDGNGIYGARFMCAAISQAFVSSDILQIIETGLAEIPQNCRYYKIVESVMAFHKKSPKEWRDCYRYLVEEWGYDRYPGVCHIIPNAGVCIMALLYGEGHFDRTIEIATMAGWDTDCNAGNVGSILGVFCGLKGIPQKYRSPINDGIVLSGISGYLNNLIIPDYVNELVQLGYRLSGEKLSSNNRAYHYNPKSIHFDFELPGSTHNIRISAPYLCRIQQTEDKAFSGKGSLSILVDRFVRGNQCRIFYKPFYSRDEFSDERYSPAFSPTVYSGQIMSFQLFLEQWTGNETPGIAPYVRTAYDHEILMGGYTKLINDQWVGIHFTIPDTKGRVIDEAGFILEGYSPASMKTLGMVYLDDFSINGKASYTIDTNHCHKEFATITPFTTDHGAWDLYHNKLHLMCNEPAMAYCGNYYARNYRISATVTPLHGKSHLLFVRAQGAKRSYYAGFNGEGKIVIGKNDFGFSTLAEGNFTWSFNHEYLFAIEVNGNKIQFLIDGNQVLQVEDSSFLYGMFGCGSIDGGRTAFSEFHFEEI